MGIKHLNRFLKEHCGDSINFTSLATLSGKKIAVDISIYMYKYATEGTLTENIYLMLSTFRQHNITPVFVFDGKPPAEKMELLKKRKEGKAEARSEYNKLKSQLDANEFEDEHEKQEILSSMDLLKRSFICIDSKQIQTVKGLIRAYGATYYDAPGEADELCAMLVIKNLVWACLSDDMDMFVYGCTRVLRYLSLVNHTVVLYDLQGILTELEITQNNLREICVLSGTDYNANDEKKTLHVTLKMFKKYNRVKRETKTDLSFYEWLNNTTKYIDDFESLKKIYSMFDLSNDREQLSRFEQITICNGPIKREDVREILKTEGFLFYIKFFYVTIYYYILCIEM